MKAIDARDRRCYRCGRPIRPRESVPIDVASLGAAFAEPVQMHEECARTYAPAVCRDRWRRVDAKTRRSIVRDLHANWHADRAIAAALGVTPRTVYADLAPD